MIKRCAYHKDKTLGYINWHYWAEKMTKKGIKQAQCETCKLWFFPQEMGKPKQPAKE